VNVARLALAVLLLCAGFIARADAVATFAGGCFWCMEHPFDVIQGVISTTSGYTGGHVKNPTYEQVSSGTTGHYETEQVRYDPSKVSYEKLLDVYWHNIDPFDAGGQFCDHGSQYRSVIFYHNKHQEELARKSKEALQKKAGPGHKIVTQILPAKTFYPAEEYHQNFYEKNPVRYKFYRYACGRDKRLKEVARILWPEKNR
jgi:peptide-methionine (S)-S-oxide reductase